MKSFINKRKQIKTLPKKKLGLKPKGNKLPNRGVKSLDSQPYISPETINNIVKVSYPLYKDIVTFEEYGDLWKKTLDLYNHLIKHRGPLQGTKRFKEIRTYALKHSLKLEVKPVPCLSLNKAGFPRDISHLKRFFYSKEPLELQMANTILNLSRLSRCSMKIRQEDIDSISSGVDRNESYMEVIENFDKALPKLLKNLRIKRNLDPKSEFENKIELFNISSQGPNSKGRNADAIQTAHLDAKAISNNMQLRKNLKNVLEEMGNDSLIEYILDLASSVEDCEKVYHSKIINVPNPENKQRIVAMVDYWTQQTLKPLEKFISRVERKVGNSFMFDQDLGRSRAKSFTEGGNTPISLDGSSFTDRFPLELQLKVLKHLFNEDFATKVGKLMVERMFYVEDLGKYVKYEVGQPMGMNSSFHLANLAHALFAYWCCLETNSEIDDSAVVGDDIIFKSDVTGEFYKDHMTKLHMEFSEFKGFTSIEGASIGEFCKKLYLNGIEISGYSPLPFSNIAKDYKYLITLKDHLKVDLSTFGDMVRIAVKPKYHQDAWDLLAYVDLMRTSEINFIRPIIDNCSNTIKDIYDDLMQIRLSKNRKAATRYVVFKAYQSVRNEENKKSMNIVQKTLEGKNYSIRPPRSSRDPISGTMSQISNLVRDFIASKVVEDKPVLRYKYQDTKSGAILTPVAWLLNKDNRGTKELENQIKFGTTDELRSLLSDDSYWCNLIDEIRQSLFKGEFTVFATQTNRFDIKSYSNDKDKKLFLLSRRLMEVYNGEDHIHRFQEV